MKKVLPLMLAAFLMISSYSIQAQTKDAGAKTDAASHCESGAKCYAGVPDMTDQQKQKIDDLCLAHKKESMQIKNQLGEKQAHLKTLQGAEKADMTAINSTIDEISALKADLMKKCAANKQAIRGLLNEKQIVAFDSKANNCCGTGGHAQQKANCNHGGAEKSNCNHGSKAGCSSHSGSGGCGKSCKH